MEQLLEELTKKYESFIEIEDTATPEALTEYAELSGCCKLLIDAGVYVDEALDIMMKSIIHSMNGVFRKMSEREAI